MSLLIKCNWGIDQQLFKLFAKESNLKKKAQCEPDGPIYLRNAWWTLIKSPLFVHLIIS